MYRNPAIDFINENAEQLENSIPLLFQHDKTSR